MSKKLEVVIALLVVVGAVNNPVRAQTTGSAGSAAQCQSPLPLVLSVSFSPDSKRLAITGAGSSAQIWDVQSEKKIRNLPFPGKHDENFRSFQIEYSPNGKYIAASSYTDAVIWDANTGLVIHSFPGISDTDASQEVGLAFTPDGNRLLISHWKGRLLWDVRADRPEWTFLYGVSDDEYPEQLSPDGQYLLVTGRLKPSDPLDMILLNVANGQVIKKFGFGSLPSYATFTPDSQNILYDATDQHNPGSAVLDVWNIQRQIVTHTITLKQGMLFWFFAPDGKHVLIDVRSETMSGNLYTDWEYWDLTSYKKLITITVDNWASIFVTFLGDGSHFVVESTMDNGAATDTIDIWNLKTGKMDGHAEYGPYGPGSSAVLSPNGLSVAVGVGTDELQLRDGKTFRARAYLCREELEF